MAKYTRLNHKYWRYLINKMGRHYTVNKFHKVISKAKEGERKNELISIYIEVFRASTSR